MTHLGWLAIWVLVMYLSSGVKVHFLQRWKIHVRFFGEYRMPWPSLVFFLKLGCRGKWKIMEKLQLARFCKPGWLTNHPLVRNFVGSEAIKWDLIDLVFLIFMDITFLQRMWHIINSIIGYILKGTLSFLDQIQRFAALSGNWPPVEIVTLDNGSVVKFFF